MGPSLLLAAMLSIAAEPSPLPEAVALRWTATSGCPERDEVRRRLAAYLARWSSTPGHGHSIEIDVHRDREAFVAEVSVQTSAGLTTRRIRSGDCEAVAEGAVLVAAVAISPVAVLSAEPVPSSRPIAGEAPVGEEAVPEAEAMPELELAEDTLEPSTANTPTPQGPPDTPSPGRASPLRGVVELDAGLSIAITPRPTLGAGLALGVRGRSFKVTVSGRGLIPPTNTRQPGPGARVDGWLVGPVGCWVPSRGRAEFPLCVGAAVGQARAQGIDVAVSRADARLLVTVDVLSALALRLDPHIALQAGVRASGVLRQASFEVQGQGEVYRVRPVGMEPFIGIEVNFP